MNKLLNITMARKKKGWTQTELAQKIGCIPQTISDIERGKNSMSVKMLETLADVLEVSTDFLLGREK